MWAVFVYFNTCVPWKAVVLANHIQSIVYCDVERPWLTLERALLAFYSFMCCTKESLWFDMNQYRVLGGLLIVYKNHTEWCLTQEVFFRWYMPYSFCLFPCFHNFTTCYAPIALLVITQILSVYITSDLIFSPMNLVYLLFLNELENELWYQIIYFFMIFCQLFCYFINIYVHESKAEHWCMLVLTHRFMAGSISL